MNVVLDTARLDDATAIAAIHTSSVRAAYREHVPAHLVPLVLESPDAPPRARGWTRWLARTQASTLVARVDDTVAGFCAWHRVRDEAAPGVIGEITAFFIGPSHWRRGLGRLLGERTLDGARSGGVGEVALWVLEPNERARRFYESLGFQPNGQARVFLEHGGATLRELRYRTTLAHG